MNTKPTPAIAKILFIAAIQGCLLYGLHWSVEQKTWPGNDPLWATSLYALTLFVPITLQILARKLSSRPTWIIAAFIAALAISLGAYAGWAAGPSTETLPFTSLFVFYPAFFSIWFIALPFGQTWLNTRDWHFPYRDLFESSWQNTLLIAEGGLFTVIFWGLLALWAALFNIVGIHFFAELFENLAFIYPVTALVFGYALYLIQSRESIVLTLRRHLLGIFCWLFPLVAAIASMFLATLPFTGLTSLWNTGHATLLMLWLQVLLVVFLNAAYEDGEASPPYPVWLQNALRVATFSMPVYAALCIYSLSLRVEQHGWTNDRVWAAWITFIITLYGIGYAIAALRKAPWMALLSWVNTRMAWVVIGSLILLLSPALDPKRLSVDSQYARLVANKISPIKFDYDYLRFESGIYGRRRLAELAKSNNLDMARLASATLAKTNRWEPKKIEVKDIATRIEVYPTTAKLPQDFIDYLNHNIKEEKNEFPCLSQEQPCVILAIDLNKDGLAEFVMLDAWPKTIYGKANGKWARIGQLIGDNMDREKMLTTLRESQVRTVPPQWPNVQIGNHTFAVQGATN